MKTNIVPNLSFAEYVAAPGINASALKIVHQFSLAHAKAHLDGAFEKESRALDFGTAFHSLVLEGREDFVVRPRTYLHAKEGEKPWNANATVCKEWMAAHDGALVVSAEEGEALLGMRKAVSAHLVNMGDGQAELSVFAERDGLRTKARIDFLPGEADRPVVDLKSCRSAHPEQFMRDALRLGYHIQAAWCLDILAKVGIRRSEFRLIAVESQPPHAVCVLRFKDEPMSALRMGRARYRAVFARLAEAQKTGRWESYGTHDAEAFIPAWYAKELEQTA